MSSAVAAWPMVALGEVLTRSCYLVDIIPNEEYAQVTVRLWGKGVALRGKVKGAEIAAARQFLVHEDQFILSRIDARNGAFGLVPHELDGAVVSNDFPAFDLNGERILPAFLAWMSRTHDFVELCKRSSEGTTNRVRLQEARFLAMQIPLPPLDEQRRIVARIEALAARIADARGLRREAMAEAGGLWLRSVEVTLSQVTHVQKLKEVARVICGQHLGPDEQAETGVPYLTGPADFTDRIACPTRFASVIKATCRPGDVLLTVKGAGVGKVNLAPLTPAVIGRQLYAIRPYEDVLDQTFLWTVLQFRLSDLREAITATTVPGIGRDDVELLDIPAPTLIEQQRIVAYLDDVRARVDALKRLQAETAAELAALLPSVLDRAFRGDL